MITILKTIKPILALIVISWLLSSCEKEDKPYVLPDRTTDAQTNQIPMGQHYGSQFFFDLGTNKVLTSSDKAAWDLGFETSVKGFRVKLNSSKFMFAYNTQSKEFDQVFQTQGLSWNWDVASGDLDSTAIGDWGMFDKGTVSSYNMVYLINRGRDSQNKKMGIKKIMFTRMENNAYQIRYANLDGTDEQNDIIQKNDNYSFAYFSFDKPGQQVNIAPLKETWDIVFTQYTNIFSETPSNVPVIDSVIPYLVTGVIQNPYGVSMAELNNTAFEDITLNDAITAFYLTGKLDVIGYDWKLFDFDGVSYSIVPQQNYIIKDADGFYYKLRFIDFYSATGERGYPKFEYQTL